MTKTTACPAQHIPAHSVEVQAADIADPASNVQEAECGDLQQHTKQKINSEQQQQKWFTTRATAASKSQSAAAAVTQGRS